MFSTLWKSGLTLRFVLGEGEGLGGGVEISSKRRGDSVVGGKSAGGGGNSKSLRAKLAAPLMDWSGSL